MATPLLGWIPPAQRTQAQHDAHARASAKMPRFAIQAYKSVTPPVGTKVILTDFWRHPLVTADIGYEFTGFHQLTGSCVGVSNGDAVFTVGAIQRTLAVNPTKAFVPFWAFTYGRTRFREGDRGQGEGAVDSVIFEVDGDEGVLEATQPGLPQFDRSDGMFLPEQTEYQWSDGASATVTKWLAQAKPQTVGTRAILTGPDDVRDANINGYSVLYGCDMYVGSGTIKGSGDNAYVGGHYDGRGGHSTCFLGYWNHPNDGELFLYSNQWPTSTYPKDPAGGGRCCCWIPRSEVAKVWSSYSGTGEIAALSHLNYFPAQPEILEWFA